MEPINGSSGGAITPPDGYWEEAEKILKENDILLIADEVMTGFGRVGIDFASNLLQHSTRYPCGRQRNGWRICSYWWNLQH